VADIIDEASKSITEERSLNVYVTDLLGNHPAINVLLADRFRQAAGI